MRHPMVGALLAAAVLVAGCGSSSNNNSKSSASGGSGSTSSGINVLGAKRNLSTIVSTGHSLDLPKLGAPVPKGKTISYISCPLAICTEVGLGVQQAAHVLGWQVRNIQENLTPASYLQAWQQVAQNPGSGVISASDVVPDSSVAKYLDKVDVPLVQTTDTSSPGGHLIQVTESPGNVYRQGEAEGDWVVLDARKPVQSVYVYDPSISSISATLPGYRSAISKNCPKCSVGTLKVNSAQVGPALAQQVVSYVQSNPNVKYVVFNLGDLATGVPAAIKAAGLGNQVKLVVRAATPPNLEDVKSGTIAAAFTDEVYEAGWRAVNGILRHLVHKPVDPLPHGKVYLITKRNLPADIGVPFTTPGYQKQFEQAWGVS